MNAQTFYCQDVLRQEDAKAMTIVANTTLGTSLFQGLRFPSEIRLRFSLGKSIPDVHYHLLWFSFNPIQEFGHSIGVSSIRMRVKRSTTDWFA